MRGGFLPAESRIAAPRLAKSAAKVHLARYRLWPDDLGRIAFALAGARSELSSKID
jgi:hypothetical protein